MEGINIQKIIGIKQRADVLNKDQIEWLVKEITNGNLHDAQIGAFLMAVYLQGMTQDEAAILTSAMTYSGEVLSWPDAWKDLIVDKHSTGGVGDKISLVLAPALASCGLKVPMISGRSLGFTGGTLDKLESIPGFIVDIDKDKMVEILEKVGCFIVSATAKIAPADKILYSIRDITNTVASLPLVCSSIVSKKAAEGPTCLVYDVKYGYGSYNKTREQAIQLANLLCSISENLGIKATSVVTKMDNPIGNTIGNCLEVMESIDCLKGGGPEDVIELVCHQGGQLLFMKGLVPTEKDGIHTIKDVLNNGKALKVFENMLKAQGVSDSIADSICNGDYKKYLLLSSDETTLKSKGEGIITNINALTFGEVSSALGNGRNKPSDTVTHNTGLKLLKTVGDSIKIGEPWVIVYHKKEGLPNSLVNRLNESIIISKDPVDISKSRIDTLIKFTNKNTIFPCQ